MLQLDRPHTPWEETGPRVLTLYLEVQDLSPLEYVALSLLSASISTLQKVDILCSSYAVVKN